MAGDGKLFYKGSIGGSISAGQGRPQRRHILALKISGITIMLYLWFTYINARFEIGKTPQKLLNETLLDYDQVRSFLTKSAWVLKPSPDQP
jgi:hypothetical protein